MNQYSNDPAESSLAKEFSDYLGAVAKEVVDPIRRNVERHQQDVDALVASISESRKGLESSLVGHQKRMDATTSNVVNSLQSLSSEMKTTVESISAGHEETRQRLLSLFSDMTAVQSDKLDKLFASLRKECVALTEQQTAVIGETVPPAVTAHFRKINESLEESLKRAEEERSKRDESILGRVTSLQDQLQFISGRAVFSVVCSLISAIGVVILLFKR